MVDPKSPQSEIVPSGELVHLATSDIIPSRNNPRRLFDAPEMVALKKNISEHGVLVPITVYRPKGQKKYSILDGERRYKCCVELEKEGRKLTIPANIVAPPDKAAGLLYMFNIHNFREDWELMPTALALKSVMEALGTTGTDDLVKLTGLSERQIERCKTLLGFPKKYQYMSLDLDPQKRIPANFWIELKPVLNVAEAELPEVEEKLGRDGIIDALLAKYRAKKIKSVIHFRRILEAFESANGSRSMVLKRLGEYISDVNLETRAAFDPFIVDPRRIKAAVEACDAFIHELDRRKLDHTIDREELREALHRVHKYVDALLSKLEGSDAPPAEDTPEAQ